MKYPLDYILSKTPLLFPNGSGYDANMILDDGNIELIHIEVADLRKAWEPLPDIIDVVMKRQGSSNMIACTLLKAALDAKDGKHKAVLTPTGLFPVENILGVSACDEEGYVQLKIVTHTIRMLTPAESNYRASYVTDRHSTTVHAPVAWMDEHFPGWSNRLLIGNSLDLPEQALASYVCKEERGENAADITHISFE